MIWNSLRNLSRNRGFELIYYAPRLLTTLYYSSLRILHSTASITSTTWLISRNIALHMLVREMWPLKRLGCLVNVQSISVSMSNVLCSFIIQSISVSILMFYALDKQSIGKLAACRRRLRLLRLINYTPSQVRSFIPWWGEAHVI